MSKTSTPSASAHPVSSTPMPRKHAMPSPATLARIRQFARAYAAPVAGLPGLVLN